MANKRGESRTTLMVMKSQVQTDPRGHRFVVVCIGGGKEEQKMKEKQLAKLIYLCPAPSPGESSG